MLLMTTIDAAIAFALEVKYEIYWFHVENLLVLTHSGVL